MSEITTMFERTAELPDCSVPFVYQYPEIEELDGHIFRHVHGGIYMAEKEFKVMPKDLWRLSRKYPDVEYIMRNDGVEDDMPVRTVFFARSYTYARHDIHSFQTFISHTQEWTDSREKTILENVDNFHVFCHNSYGAEQIEGASYGKFSYAFPDENNTYLGYRKHIVIDGLIGYMFLPGIYYFGYTQQDISECGTSDEWRLKGMLRAIPCMDIGMRFKEKTAAIASSEDFHPTLFADVQYLAVGEENICVLEKMLRTIGSGKSSVFFWEFATEDSARSKDFKEIQEERWKNLEQKVPIEDGAEELLPQIGIMDIQAAFKYIFCPRVAMKRYEHAYKIGDRLILVEREGDGRALKHEYDLRLMEELVVRITVQMRCGVMMERDYLVIDCRDEKEKQVLTDKAYELFVKHCKAFQ